MAFDTILAGLSTARVAVLHQKIAPPSFNGVSKPLKPGGYKDSSADIAFNLQQAGLTVVTPVHSPDPAQDLDWSFPDTKEGILDAIMNHGATHLWANTVLFASHPLVFLAQSSQIPPTTKFVGQSPAKAEKYDDKAWTNNWLKSLKGLENTFPQSWIINRGSKQQVELGEVKLPCVMKPVRGRGSHGVKLVKTREELSDHGEALFGEGNDQILIEEYCEGEEITITVMPPGEYTTGGIRKEHWALPVVTRFNHVDGIAPYSGISAVTTNSRILPPEEFARNKYYQEASRACELIGKYCDAWAPIRIDARRFGNGKDNFGLFDINMKPNTTGPGRPGRDDQDSLTALAAAGLGWKYQDVLVNTLNQARTVI